MSTLEVAEQILGKLNDRLVEVTRSTLPAVRSVFITGSFIRGDWFDRNSDLDIGVLFYTHATEGERSRDLMMLRSAVDDRTFASHTPGGIDWNTQTFLPTEQTRGTIAPYLPYSVFLFDFVQHLEILWGDDFRSELPEPLDPSALAASAAYHLRDRLVRYGDTPDNQRRAAFLAYKATQLLQLRFGLPTLDKFNLPSLYAMHVPDFAHKSVGEEIIAEYGAARYPERPPVYHGVSFYVDFVEQSCNAMTIHPK